MTVKQTIDVAFQAASQTTYATFSVALRNLYEGHVVNIVRALEAVAAQNVQFPIAAITIRGTHLKRYAPDGVASISSLALCLEDMAAIETAREANACFRIQLDVSELKRAIRDAVYDYLASDSYSGCLVLPCRDEDGAKRYTIAVKAPQLAKAA